MRTKATITVTNRGVSRPSGWNGTIAGVYCPSGSAKVRLEESRKFRVVLGGSADEVFREGAGVEVRYDGAATECRL